MLVTKSNLQTKSYNGFTLIEVVVAVFVFLIIMMSVSQVFVSAFQGYNFAKTVQKDLEAAQFSVNTMAKELRNGSVVKSSSSYVQFYDHLHGKCIRYLILGTDLQVTSKDESPTKSETDKQNDCAARNLINFPAPTTIAGGIQSGTFQATGSNATALGKVTISLIIGENSLHQARMQTTVSLRDYGAVGM